VEPTLARLQQGMRGLRVAVAAGHFKRGAAPEALAAVARAAQALDVTREIEIPEAARARAAAFVITASEGASLHLPRLRTRACDFDPAVRDRLLAGACVPAALVVKAQKFRRWYRAHVLKLFEGVDAILAPATPFPAPRIGQQTMHSRVPRSRCDPTLASSRSRSPLSAYRWCPCLFHSRRCPSAFRL
jgi:1-carboxybiuret hydrolase